MKTPLFFAVVISAATVASSVKADLITNGGFEQGGTGWIQSNFQYPFSAIVNVESKSGQPVSPFPTVVNDKFGFDHGFITPNTGGYYAALNNDHNGNGPA